MKKYLLDSMQGGWFVGAFSPTSYHTADCEVGVKCYVAGDRSAAHLHKIATEITLVYSGTVKMGGEVLKAGEIGVVAPGEVSDFEALTDAVVFVAKVPSVAGDKYDVS